MIVNAINNVGNTYFRGIGSKVSDSLEGAAATLPTKTSQTRKTISVELHNALVKLTAYRVAILFAAIGGLLGFKTADKISDNDNEDFANIVQCADIDTTAQFKIKDMNHDGSADIIVRTKDGSTMILDLKNSNVLMETTGFKEVE